MRSRGELAYEDFEVEISLGRGQEYPVAIINSPAGEAHETMRFPFDELALENHLLTLKNALLQSGGKYRLALSQEEQAVQNFGKALWNALFTGEMRNRYDVSLERANREGKGLRLKLRIQSPKLAAIPWEFMYEPRQNEYMCLSRSISVVRYLELPQPVQPLAVEPPLRILGMAVSPANLCPLDIAREKQRVEEAIKSLQADGLVELTWLQGQTWRDLQEAMQTGIWHIFYFIGHGGFDCNIDEGLIALADEEGKSQHFRATHLGRLLADHRSLRLVILNSCEGARGSEHDIFSCTASILVQRGIPAVLAMQYEITDRAAIEFSRAFYKALANGLSVDAAVTEARKAVSFAIENTIEWGTPVLYMRSPDGVLFNIPEQKPKDNIEERREQEARLAELSALYSKGIEALGAQDWPTAIKYFNDILILDASYSDAGAKLKEAEQQLGLAKKKERQQLEGPEEEDEQGRITGENEKSKGGHRRVLAALIVIAVVGMTLITPSGPPWPLSALIQTPSTPTLAPTLTPTPSSAPKLKVSPSSYKFDISPREGNMKAFSISNIGGGILEWNLSTKYSWIKLDNMSGSNNGSVFITADTTGLSVGSYLGTVMVTSNGGTEQVTIELNVISPTPTPAPTTSAPITPAPTASAPITPAPTASAPITPAPITPAPITPAPITPAPITPAPTASAPITPAPTTSAPITPAPTASAPITPTTALTSTPPTPVLTAMPPTFQSSYTGMEFVLIQSGEFDMGSPSTDVESHNEERPVHHVTISKAFYMGRYEVTQKQWRDVMGTSPSYFTGDDLLPVDNVSWDDVQQFIQKLNEKEGTNKYRLPSEAEWEYAVRAGTTTRYFFGDSNSSLGDYAWYERNSNNKTHPVGQRNPNAWGLYDMYGNVLEWVQDIYHSSYVGAPTDGSAWEGDGCCRVMRGGGSIYFPRFCRSAGRDGSVSSNRGGGWGFRLLRDL